ncbi:MAG: twin transmembrane helix small protein [bacterium]|nr:twin transmembrane helix small protein [bacterium]
MLSLISILIVLAVFSVATILLFDLVNMSRDGSVSLSQKLMRWRVGMQFVAILLVMLSFYFSTP